MPLSLSILNIYMYIIIHCSWFSNIYTIILQIFLKYLRLAFVSIQILWKYFKWSDIHALYQNRGECQHIKRIYFGTHTVSDMQYYEKYSKNCQWISFEIIQMKGHEVVSMNNLQHLFDVSVKHVMFKFQTVHDCNFRATYRIF